MTAKRNETPGLVGQVKARLQAEPGLTVKDLASRLQMNRQFMAGFLAAIEELGEVSHRAVGPARIYFNVDPK